MKLGPVTKLEKSDDVKLKLKMTSCRQIKTSWSFFQFMVNLEQSRSWIPDSWSVILTFSLTFCLTKTENRTKKSLPQLLHFCFE